MNNSFDIIQFVKTLKQRKHALEEALRDERKSLGGVQNTLEELGVSLVEARAKSASFKNTLSELGGGQGSEDLLIKRLLVSAEALLLENAELRSQLIQRSPELAEQFALLSELEAEQLLVARMQYELGEEAASSRLVAPPSGQPPSEDKKTPYLPIGQVLNGRYKVAKLLGKGGTGAVYGVTDQRTPQVWALKELWSDNPTFNVEQIRHQLQAEVRVLSGLRHSNLPRIVDSFEENGRHYIVMDYVEGQSLSRVLSNHKKLPIKHALEVGLKLASVLSYLHAQEPPIIFRDLKPANIMVKEDGDVKLVDFGIARYFAKNSSHDTQALGTPGYAAPEQYGGGQSDQTSDVYALGANLHQMLTGVNPGDSPFRFDPLRRHCPEISPEFEKAIAKCVELDQVRRPESVMEIREEIIQEIRRRNGGVLPIELEALDDLPTGGLEDSTVLEDSQALATVQGSASKDETASELELQADSEQGSAQSVNESLSPFLLLLCFVPVFGVAGLIKVGGRLGRENCWSGKWGLFFVSALLVQTLLIFSLIR